MQEDVHLSGLGHTVEHHVGKNPLTRQGVALERDIKGMADSRVGAVTGDQPRSLDCLFTRVWVAKCAKDCGISLRDTDEFDGTFDAYTEALEVFVKHSFSLTLRDHQAVRVW